MKRDREVRNHRLVYILCFLLLLLIGLVSGGWAPWMAMLFMAVYAAAAFGMSRAAGRQLEVSSGSGAMVSKGETMDLELTFANRGRLPVFWCVCRIEARNLLTGESQFLPVSCSLAPGGKRTEKLALTDRYCGKVEIRPRDLRVCDPLRIFAQRLESRASWTGYFAPEFSGAVIPDEFLDSYNMESYQYSQHEKGSDPGEVFGVRDYQEGDSLKQIHWKLSAKLGNVTVKIPSYPIENNILLILDNLLDPAIETGPEERSRLVERFYSLSNALLEKDIPHSIGWYDVTEQIFQIRRITGTDQLQETIPEVLGCGFENSESSTILRYLESMEGRGYTNHFLVTSQQGRDADRLETYGAVNVFRETKEQ